MAMGIGLFTVAGIAGAIFYVVHHIVAMTTLFLTAGLIEHIGGSSRLSRLGEMVRSAPVVATPFLLPALGLAGIPPPSGFVPKVALVDAGRVSAQPAVVAIRLLVSLLTLSSLVNTRSGVFVYHAAAAPHAPPPAGG